MLVRGICQTLGKVHSLEQTPKSGFSWAHVNSLGSSVETSAAVAHGIIMLAHPRSEAYLVERGLVASLEVGSPDRPQVISEGFDYE